jgi:hypothetical protein
MVIIDAKYGFNDQEKNEESNEIKSRRLPTETGFLSAMEKGLV